jgi:hypothetical protein
MSSYKSRKSIHGDDNQQNEIASHNKIHFSDSGSLQIVTIFACLIIIASFGYMALFQAALLSTLVTLTFVGVIVLAWLLALSFLIRHGSTTRTQVAIDKTERSHAILEAHLIHAAEQYAIYKDENGSIQFRGTVQVTENRQFLPQLPAPKDATDGILTSWDSGMTARGIEKHLNANLPKDQQISYYQITKTLDLHRKGWNKKTVLSEKEDV